MLVLVLAVPAFAARTTGRGTGPTIHVTDQDLVYDSIVTADPLPWNGQDNWQLLTPGGANGAVLTTQFGPGDVGYRGGRWYMDNASCLRLKLASNRLPASSLEYWLVQISWIVRLTVGVVAALIR